MSFYIALVTRSSDLGLSFPESEPFNNHQRLMRQGEMSPSSVRMQICITNELIVWRFKTN